MVYFQQSLFGKMSWERFHQMTGWILEPSYPLSQTPMFQCLLLEDGQEPEWCEGERLTSAGGSWTPSIGQAPGLHDGSAFTTGKCGAYLLPYFYAKRHETVMLLCLDAKCKVLCCKEVTEGSVNSASISVRRVVETALGANASTVVLAHNHPSGLAIPSAEDVQTTRRIAKALSLVEITLADHIVVAEDDFVSLAQSGLFHPGVDFED